MTDVRLQRRRPAFQFYPGDWRRDSGLRSCSVAAHGLWIEMICLMHEGEPYGHLRIGAKAISVELLARMVGEKPAVVRQLISELEEAGVFSRLADGTVFSRRMVRDEHLRDIRADGGKASVNHPTVAARRRDRPNADRMELSFIPPLSLPLSPPFTPPPASASASASASAGGSGSASGSAITTAAAQRSARPVTRSKRAIFTGRRFVVFEWQLDNLRRMLGDHADGFDLRAWFEALDHKARDSPLVIPQRDRGAWLLSETLEEARRRGLPIAVAPTPSGRAN
jgi:hypothetical protein